MADYIDGFAFPIAQDRLDAYRRLADAAADVWKEHGALDYREYVADDLALEGTRSFLDTVGARDGEVVVFGWVTFASREARDIAGEKVASDPRMEKLMAATDSGFDPERMAYAGFRPLVLSSERDAE